MKMKDTSSAQHWFSFLTQLWPDARTCTSFGTKNHFFVSVENERTGSKEEPAQNQFGGKALTVFTAMDPHGDRDSVLQLGLQNNEWISDGWWSWTIQLREKLFTVEQMLLWESNGAPQCQKHNSCFQWNSCFCVFVFGILGLVVSVSDAWAY